MVRSDFTLKAACRLFHLWTGAKSFGTVRINGHIVARIFKDRNGRECCVRMARDYYHSFSLHFPEVPFKGYGQAVNLELLKRLEKLNIDNLITIMSLHDGVVAYASSVKELLGFYRRHQTDVPHLDGEVAFPVSLMVRFFPQRGLKAGFPRPSFLTQFATPVTTVAAMGEG